MRHITEPCDRPRAAIIRPLLAQAWSVSSEAVVPPRDRVGGHEPLPHGTPPATSGPSGAPEETALRLMGLGLMSLALIACVSPCVTVVPEALQDVAPLPARVDPHLFALTERWVSGGTAGAVPVGDLLRQVLVDDPQAPLRLTYVTSHLDVATVVSPIFYRPRAYQARYHLTVRATSVTTGVRQAWLQGVGESRSLAGVARATHEAVTQAVRDLSGRLARRWEADGAGGKER
jgi:hypothetical protein